MLFRSESPPSLSKQASVAPDKPDGSNVSSRARSKAMKIYPKGTIIEREFEDEMYEGRIVGYDDNDNYYKISYVDGDSEEMTHQEVKQHYKPSQKFSAKSQRYLLDFERGTGPCLQGYGITLN